MMEVQAREMYEKESIARFRDGLKLALSCSREMEVRQPKRGWDTVTKGFWNIIQLTDKLLDMKGQTKSELAAGIARVSELAKISPDTNDY